MSDEPVTVSPSAKLAEAYDLMAENEIRRLLVVRSNELLGIVTLSDIVRALPSLLGQDDSERDTASSLLLTEKAVSDVMAWDPVTIGADDTIQDAAERMLEYQVSGLPVVDGNRPVGIITESDIFRLVVDSWAEDDD